MSSTTTTDAAAHIKVYSYYEIDRSKLSSNAPHQLNFIRIVMVTEKSKTNVSLRYPSLNSVRAYFADENRTKPEGKKLPALDEKYAMELEVAVEVLYRRIPSNEFAVQRNQWSFWVSGEKMATEGVTSSPVVDCGFGVSNKKGVCWYELEGTGMVKWGQRRQVRYLGRHVEEGREQEVLYNVKVEDAGAKGKEKVDVDDDDEDEEEEKERDESEGEEKAEQEEEEEEEDEEEEVEVVGEGSIKADKLSVVKRKNFKRKSHGSSRNSRSKRAKTNQTQKHRVVYNQHKNKTIKNSIERWSVARYNLAEESMLKILKEKGAVFGNPILRSALRSEARRLIGDTGLLDHLLKHMAGKVAPGGKERFRRRHNSEGAMEYWLESADLVDVRKEAGVQDPYWTPPPGWKLGDNPTQDPVCAREIKLLKEEVAKIKRYNKGLFQICHFDLVGSLLVCCHD